MYDMPPLPDAASGNKPVEPIKKPERVFTKPQKIFALIAPVLGYLFIKLCLAGELGAGATVFFLLYIAAVFAVMKKSGAVQSRKSYMLMTAAATFSLYFTLSANTLLKVLNMALMIILLTLWAYSVNNENFGADDYFAYTSRRAILSEPFMKFGECSAAISSIFKVNKLSKTIGYVFIGLFTAFPATLIAAALLSSADERFSNIIESLFTNIGEKLIVNGFQIFAGIPFGFYICGLVFSAITSRADLAKEREKDAAEVLRMRGLHPIIVISSLVPLCVLYVMFFFSQLSYFVSAFEGVLPENYIVSEYARRGFFELCFVALLNLTVIIVANLVCKNSEGSDSRPKILGFFTVLLSAFTLVLIATAMSKMILYIGSFGLTRMRVYTSWFMALLAVIFVLIILRRFIKINIAKIGAYVFVGMFFVLTFGNVDNAIMRYNYYAYTSGYIAEFDTRAMNDLSDDCVFAVSDIISSNPGLEKELTENIGQDSSEDLRKFTVPAAFARHRFNS